MVEKVELKDLTKKLAAVAQGIEKADLVIKNTRLVNVCTAEILENMDIAVAGGRIALLGDAAHTIGANTRVIDAKGMYAAPGFMDGHMHVESSMMTVSNYARTVIPRGTTAIFADPHEIANVLGAEGVELMLKDGENTPFRFYVAMPSCVPAVDAFEDAGAAISPDDVEHFMPRPDVCGLGEMMNFPGILSGDDNMHKEVQVTHKYNKTVTGHYSMPETGAGLNAYISAGIRCCHESVRAEDALAKMRLGMYAQIREGSAWRDLKEVIRAVTETGIDTRFATVVSDDAHPDTLLNMGHMDHILRRTVQEGVNPVKALQMATINVAECFFMSRDLGSITPGKCADILLISDLSQMKVESVFIGGVHVAEKGEMIVEFEGIKFPDWSKNTMKLPPLKEEDLQIKAPEDSGETVNTKVIEIIEAKVGTYLKNIDLPVINGFIKGIGEKSILKAVVIERHKNTGTMGKGFVKGFHIENGAVASTVAHDAHNLLIVGDNDADMVIAGNALRDAAGGMAAVQNGKVIAILPLPVAGLMSEDDAKTVADKVEVLDEAWKTLGCDMVSPFMTMALLSLAVLPELRLTNRGLIDTINYKFTNLFN